MGVTEDRRHVYFSSNPVGGGDDRRRRNSDSSGSSDDGGWEIIPRDGIADAPLEPEAPPPPPPPRRQRTPPSPLLKKRVPICGHELKLKKGKRARRRYDNERSLIHEAFGPAASEMDPEDYLTESDIGEKTRSHFTTLMEEGNARLLEAFLDMQDEDVDEDLSSTKSSRLFLGRTSTIEDPEDAFLNISGNVRHALKKQFPTGMLDGLEVEIRDFFIEKPDDVFVADELSSYERLLAHAACMYHQLHARSFDDNGKRKLKVTNSRGKRFKPIDPSLSKYLGMRSSRKEE